MSTKTLSIRMDEDNYKFLSAFAKEEKEGMSKITRKLVKLGRIAFAVEKYKQSKVSIGKASKIAGVSISEMMDILEKYGVETNIEYEDYLKGLKNLRKVW